MRALRVGAIGAIRFYQWFLSPALPRSCRFLPSCSAYAAEAIELHGLARGAWLGLKRVARCHPWGGSGWDPVPLQGHDGHRCRHDDPQISAG